MRVNLGLDLFGYNEMSDFLLDLFDGEVECLSDLSHIDHFVRGDVLYKSFPADVLHQRLNPAPEEQIETHLLSD